MSRVNIGIPTCISLVLPMPPPGNRRKQGPARLIESFIVHRAEPGWRFRTRVVGGCGTPRVPTSAHHPNMGPVGCGSEHVGSTLLLAGLYPLLG